MQESENLYVVAMEECAELQQALSKGLRFGMYNHHPDRPYQTNAQEVLHEYYQLQGVMEMIIDHGLLGHIPEDEIAKIKSEKRRRVSDYTQLSKSLRTVMS